MTFQQKLEAAQGKNNSLLCIGLDPDFDQMPERFRKTIHPQFTFNKWIIDQTHDLVCAFKPNSAFYEARGVEGIAELKATCDYIREKRQHIPVILDFKRADIGNTNNGSVTFAFDYLKVDAVTVNPYLGQEAIQPFLDRKDKGIIVLCKTSNPGSGEFQDITIRHPEERSDEGSSSEQDSSSRHSKTQNDNMKLFEYIAQQVTTHWNTNNNCLLVVGATYPEELKKIRQIVGDMTILVPGIGSQQGDVEKSLRAGLNSKKRGLLLNVSRSVIFSENPREQARSFVGIISKQRES